MPVVDANILCTLAKAERLDLLPSLFGSLSTPPEVMRELRHVAIAGFTFVEQIERLRTHGEATADRWLRIVAPSREETEEKEALLDHGLAPADAECLALANHRGERLLTDDRHLGRVARARGVDVADLPTLLLAAGHRSVFKTADEAMEVLRRIEERDYYTFPVGFRIVLLQSMGENGRASSR